MLLKLHNAFMARPPLFHQRGTARCLLAGAGGEAHVRCSDPEAVCCIVGASRGIGLAMAKELLTNSRFNGLLFCLCRSPQTSTSLSQLVAASGDRCVLVQVDVTDEHSIQTAAQVVGSRSGGRVDLLLNTVGVLHEGRNTPERSIRAVTPDWMVQSFIVHAVGPTLLAKHFSHMLAARAQRPTAVFASVSARVGSISDNKLGGWHSYRVSKAAHNQAIRNIALELMPRRVIALALHPGTVETDLSTPFMKLAAKKYKILKPNQSARKLLDIIDRAEMEDSGGFYAWDGTPVPF
eukprot:CAMPEP_0119330572 /NCGR_PEP_ID=MMETSP1333-20130426/78525_1 /TAXON_ID=418940 /ORGANISM="Scyphosphaera apsteinii, Strain RCC1455" /LENGTH=292 /DNA_ID=CAMNT_0007339975 /DNA_START=30 /DNA_END=908 /DNA_ORIENTATION=+